MFMRGSEKHVVPKLGRDLLGWGEAAARAAGAAAKYSPI